ncbi:MAG: 16S rRNA (guanine(966)-N(2))-methyltransferase RsmD [Candidatus Lindowbacteria bacterium]|nr:16S rRNA (guanine(966)-N(2))-methyltransferase RsmD [Candidatus Lindowbacteria bacterium]
MRITGGQAKGILIKAPKNMRTRPTSDKVREALFDTLGGNVIERNVLDLFAGSGALAIEALSRGANYAALVERDSVAVSLIEENLERAGFSEKAETFRADFRAAIRKFAKSGRQFDLILIDPPYQSGLLEQIALALAEHRILLPRAIVVLEHFRKTDPPPSISDIPLSRTRFYGQTALSYFFS